MEPILTQSEMDALLQPTAAEESAAEVRTIDLVARDHRAYALLPELQSVADRLATKVEQLCAKSLRVSCQAKADPVEVVPPSRLPDLLGDPRYSYGLSVDGEEGGLVAVDAAIGAGFLLCTFGGELNSGDDDEEPENLIPEAPPTFAERRVVHRLANDFAGLLKSTLGGICPTPLDVDSEPPKSNRDSAVVLIMVRLTLGEHATYLAASLSTSAAGFRLPKRVVETEYTEPEEAILFPEILKVPLQVTSVLGRCDMTMKEFLALKVGSVLTLDSTAEDPLPLIIQGRKTHTGKPLLSRGNLSLEIIEAVKE
jgi:flagellar motor switch protein FliM